MVIAEMATCTSMLIVRQKINVNDVAAFVNDVAAFFW